MNRVVHYCPAAVNLCASAIFLDRLLTQKQRGPDRLHYVPP